MNKLKWSVLLIVFGIIFTNPGVGQTGWMDFAEETLKKVTKSDNKVSGAELAGLSQNEITMGLKEALIVGFKKAIALLGKDGGYLNDAKVKIPMPGLLSHAETALRSAGQGEVADQFIKTMNSAAEKAIPVTADIFADAIRNLTVKDAQAILQGPNDAATQYFKRTSGKTLTKAIRPIVENSTKKVGLTSAYKSLTGVVGEKMGFLSGIMGQDSLDLDGYVTQKGIDGLFLKLAEEEARIRANPMARGSDILKKVFGSVSL
ncbi:MAG: DUF4197 domain-containing protein [Magnetococcales bacterium]|nr:DUF4197 domain-containing protein [Magnetococcales bacterium]